MTRPLRLRSEGLVWRAVGGQIVLLDMASSSYVSANSSAAALWDHLAAGTDRDQLVEALVAAHGIERQEAERDVDRFIDRLDTLGFLDG